MHPMHYPTYQQSYYGYGQHSSDLCYPPPPPPFKSKYFRGPHKKGYPTCQLFSPIGGEHLDNGFGYPSLSLLFFAVSSLPKSFWDLPNLLLFTSDLCYPPPYQPQPTQMQTPSGQLVPTAPPNSQQHMVDPYSPYYTTGYGPTGAQCYSTRGIQTPFIGKQMYEVTFTHKAVCCFVESSPSQAF